MTTTTTARGYYLHGSRKLVQAALMGYFERGFTIVPGSASRFLSGGKNYGSSRDVAFVEVELREDWPMRLDERERWKRNRRTA